MGRLLFKLVFYVQEVAYTSFLLLLLLIWITLVDGKIDVHVASSQNFAVKGDNFSIYWKISNAYSIYRLGLYKHKTSVMFDAAANWISLKSFTVNKTSVSIKSFVEGDKMYCVMTIHNVSYADDASEYVMKVTYVTLEPFEKFEENATFRINVTGGPEFCGVILRNVTDINDKKTEVEICGNPKPEVKFYTTKIPKLPVVCKLTENRLKKYKCKVELTDVQCGEMMYLESRGYRDLHLNSSSLLISNYTPLNISYKTDWHRCHSIAWSIQHLGMKCVKKYELKVLLDDELPLTNATITVTSTKFYICYTSIQYVKLRAVSLWNDKSNWVIQKINVRTIAQRKDNDLCHGVIISTCLAFVLVVLIILLLKRKKLFKKHFVNKHQLPLQNVGDENDDDYELAGATSSHYADLNRQFITPSVYAELTINKTAGTALSNYTEVNV